MMRTILLSTLICGLTACSDPSKPENESAGEVPDGGTTAVEAEGACECDPEAEDESCGPQLCPVTFLHCERDCAASSQGDEQIEAMQCVLEAMRDRTPGFVAWVFTQDVAPSWSWTGMRIFADGSAAILRRATASCQAEGTPAASGPDETVLLADVAYFDACLAEPDPIERFRCMQEPVKAALSECAPRVVTCE